MIGISRKLTGLNENLPIKENDLIKPRGDNSLSFEVTSISRERARKHNDWEHSSDVSAAEGTQPTDSALERFARFFAHV